MERGWKPNVEISPACPRCGSSNTKFCYYNNYSLTQPRYFCKGCRRYWTKGGSLRNVPVGGGCRKSRRGKPIHILTDRLPSRSCLAYGGASGHSGNPLVEPTSSSMVPDGPNIDLSLVYANFLNQKPEPEAPLEMPELPSDVDSSFDFSSVADMNVDFSTHLPLENSSNNGLPPLPGEEVACDQETAWSNAPMVFANDLSHAATQQPARIELPEAQHPDNQLIVDGSPFNLSSYGTTFRP
ncbi:hypothetical protein F0562_015927 [Nyssa sinensis]|uniref:Dof zinc finger protein n=1 Tax=Nyssa sinensis TaxID=561372 RepID=A0A5J4ZI78_9ASTE|nr:hypothetical protein F0562_015927 [Nyssa sinensis]